MERQTLLAFAIPLGVGYFGARALIPEADAIR
jgi:hypothetical protein